MKLAEEFNTHESRGLDQHKFHVQHLKFYIDTFRSCLASTRAPGSAETDMYAVDQFLRLLAAFDEGAKIALVEQETSLNALRNCSDRSDLSNAVLRECYNKKMKMPAAAEQLKDILNHHAPATVNVGSIADGIIRTTFHDALAVAIGLNAKPLAVQMFVNTFLKCKKGS